MKLAAQIAFALTLLFVAPQGVHAQGKGGGAIIERLFNMTPDQRQKALQRLPPARQRQAARTLRMLDELSPEERRVLRGRFQMFLDMPPARQRAIRQEIRALRMLTRQERRRRLASEDVRSKFSEMELQLLYETTGLPEQ